MRFENDTTHKDEKSTANAVLFSFAEENVIPRKKNDTFSPVREKVSKERTFVRSELTPYKSKIGTVSKVSIGAHYSGGIMALFA